MEDRPFSLPRRRVPRLRAPAPSPAARRAGRAGHAGLRCRSRARPAGSAAAAGRQRRTGRGQPAAAWERSRRRPAPAARARCPASPASALDGASMPAGLGRKGGLLRLPPRGAFENPRPTRAHQGRRRLRRPAPHLPGLSRAASAFELSAVGRVMDRERPARRPTVVSGAPVDPRAGRNSHRWRIPDRHSHRPAPAAPMPPPPAAVGIPPPRAAPGASRRCRADPAAGQRHGRGSRCPRRRRGHRLVRGPDGRPRRPRRPGRRRYAALTRRSAPPSGPARPSAPGRPGEAPRPAARRDDAGRRHVPPLYPQPAAGHTRRLGHGAAAHADLGGGVRGGFLGRPRRRGGAGGAHPGRARRPVGADLRDARRAHAGHRAARPPRRSGAGLRAAARPGAAPGAGRLPASTASSSSATSAPPIRPAPRGASPRWRASSAWPRRASRW